MTEEDLNRDHSLMRFRAYERKVGVTFIDDYPAESNTMILVGWIAHKYKHLAKELYAAVSGVYGLDNGEVYDWYVKESAENGSDNFYRDYSEFLNSTDATKQRINKILFKAEWL